MNINADKHLQYPCIVYIGNRNILDTHIMHECHLSHRLPLSTYIQIKLSVTCTLLECLLEATDGGLSHETFAEIDNVRGQGIVREVGVARTHMEELQKLIYLYRDYKGNGKCG